MTPCMPRLMLLLLIWGCLVATKASGEQQLQQLRLHSSFGMGHVAGWAGPPSAGKIQDCSSSSSNSRELQGGLTSASTGDGGSSSNSRHLLGPWTLLGARSTRLTGGVLQQLLAASDSNNEAAANAAKEAASSQGKASRLLLKDLQLDSSSTTSSSAGKASSGDKAPPRLLATAAQGPAGSSGQGLLPVGGDAQPLCSATINYGASVGDASKKATADVPIFVGSMDVVVTQPQNLDPQTTDPQTTDAQGRSRWVVGWQFAAGEYIQMSRDVFGDEGIQDVFMAPSLQGPTDTAGADAQALPSGRGVLGQTPQRVAVFSNTSLGGSNGEVVFSFVGRKGPEQPPLPNAPFRVAPPTYVFLNNHYCWPLFRPSGSSGNSPAAVAAAAVGRSSNAPTPTNEQQQQQQQMVEVSTPRLAPADMPTLLQVEYLPVSFMAGTNDPALFSKTVTEFYFKVTNTGSKPVYLDQVLLQYWFHGPLDSSVGDDANTTMTASGGSGGGGVSDVVARVSASQFRLTCSDATAEIGCGGLAWNITIGLPTVFGARYVLNVWFPGPAQLANSSSSVPRYVLLPSSGNSSISADSNSSSSQLPLESVKGADGKPVLIQPLTAVQAIVAIEPRRFFANISASNDYSFKETPELTGHASNTTDGQQGKLVRRKREPNTQMPAFISQQLAWGSPPVGGRLAPKPGSGTSSPTKAYPPGSYCQPSPGGGLVCGIDVLYCCLGSGPLNLTAVPTDWPQRLASGTNPTAATNLTGTAVPGTVASPEGGSSKGGLPTWGIALAVVLPVLGVVAAVAGGFACMRRRRSRRARLSSLGKDNAGQRFKPFRDGSTGESHRGDTMLGVDQLPVDPSAQGNWLAAAAAGAGTGVARNSTLLTSLLSPQNSHTGSAPEGWSAADAASRLDAAERGQGAAYGSTLQQQQQQPADWQLASQQAGGDSSSHRSLSPLQAAGVGAAPAVAAATQLRLLRVLKPKVPSLPGDVIAAAAKFAKQQHMLQLPKPSGSVSSPPGSPFAKASQVAFPNALGSSYQLGQGRGDSAASESSDDSDNAARCHTWTGRLHEDAFEDDLLDQLLNLHVRPQLISSAAPTSPTTTDGIWQQLQQQQQMPPSHGAGAAAAAAVEAAVAAINSLLTGSTPSPAGPSPRLSRYPRARRSRRDAGDDASGADSPRGLEQSGPSFYKALMATGGVLRPPGGPPIPLNVDFAAEIQPNLGRLLGRGGFGHVYEATWRGQRVAVKLLTVDTEDPAVLDAFLKEVALCACLRGCDRVVRLLGACLGGCSPPPGQRSPPPPGTAGSSYSTANSSTVAAAAAVAAADAAAAAAAANGSADAGLLLDGHSIDITPFQAQLPPDVLADDTPPNATGPDGSSNTQQQQQQQWALIMELVEGGNLAHRIYHPSKRRLSYLEILQIGLDVASGLAYLHPAVVHRDLKPQNVLLDKHGRAKIADFGISRFKDPHRSYLSVTHQGGTPNYMAPELFNASRVDEAADVYSLGCILYECIAKQQPFGHLAEDGKSFNVLFKIIVAVAINKERPPLPHDTPPRLASLILRCWSENPALRPRVDELLAELDDMMQEALQERAERTRRTPRISSRTQSLPNQRPHHQRNNSISSQVSNVSGTSGASSPSRAGVAAQGARTMPPLNAAPRSHLTTAASDGGDSAGSMGLWHLQADALHPHSLLGQYQQSPLGSQVYSEVAPLPSIASAIAARPSSQQGFDNSNGHVEGCVAADASGGSAADFPRPSFSLKLHTGAAAALSTAGTLTATGSGRLSHQSSTYLGSHDPSSSPRPFHDQQLLVLQQEAAAAQHQQQQQQQQRLDHKLLGQTTSLESSCYSRAPWRCACHGSPEPCAACAGSSSSSSDCGSAHGGCGSSNCSAQRTPSGPSPHQSPGGARHLQVLPQIPQDMPAMDVHVPAYAAAAAAATAADCGIIPQQSSLVNLQQHMLRPKASVASPQTPARHAYVGRKPSHLSSKASGLFSSQGSYPPASVSSSSSSDLLYCQPGPSAATAYPALRYPLRTDNMAAATAAAFSNQPSQLLQQGPASSAGMSNSGGSAAAMLQQQQLQADGPYWGQAHKQPSSSVASAVSAGSSSRGSSLPSQKSGGLPRHSLPIKTSSSGGVGSSSSGGVLRGLHVRRPHPAAAPGQEQQEQQEHNQQLEVQAVQRHTVAQRQPGSVLDSTASHHSNSHSGSSNCSRDSSPQRRPYKQVQPQVELQPLADRGLNAAQASAVSSHDRAASVAGLHCASSLGLSEQQGMGELSSSQSSTPTTLAAATAASTAVGSIYSCGSGVSSNLHMRSFSMDGSSATQCYNNPLFGVSTAATADMSSAAWQPQLQTRYSEPAMGGAGRTSSAAAALQRPASAEGGLLLGPVVDVSRHRLHSTSSSSTGYVTACTHTVAAVGAAGAAEPAVDASGDFSMHLAVRQSRDAPGPVGSSTSSGSRHGAAAAVGVGARAAAAVTPAVVVPRKVSFAEADEVLGLDTAWVGLVDEGA